MDVLCSDERTARDDLSTASRRISEVIRGVDDKLVIHSPERRPAGSGRGRQLAGGGGLCRDDTAVRCRLS